MGLLTEDTQEEKDYKRLIKNIKSASNNSEITNFLVDYVSAIRDKKRNNDFVDFEFLEAVILEMINSSYSGFNNFTTIFTKTVLAVKYFLPEGEETPEYAAIKHAFISNFSSGDGLIAQDLFDYKFYSLFSSRLDYLTIANLIKSNPEYQKNYKIIVQFACAVAPYCINAQTFKNEIISFIAGLTTELDDFEQYINSHLMEAKKRMGIYPIDEKELALISEEAERAQRYIAKLEAMQKKIDSFCERVDTKIKSGRQEISTSINNGKKEINDTSKSAVEAMQKSIEDAKEAIIKNLDDYLLTLEQSLKASSDEVFKQILQDAQKKIDDIRLLARGLSSNTTTDLLRVQKTAEEGVARLREYVETEPQLQAYLKSAADNQTIMEALKKFSEMQVAATTSATVTSNPQSGIIIPGYDRLVIPAGPSVIIPKEPTQSMVIPAFDEAIPFDERMNRILAEKRRREENGEFFHEMVEEVIRCIIEGDWVYIWGPSGCGKSYVIKQAAELIGIDLIDNGKITDKYSIMAYNDPHGRFRATQTFIALFYGKMISYDEFDNGNTDTHVVLTSIYSNLLDVLENLSKPRYITFAEDMTVPINPNFRIISAGNTRGSGENEIFSSRGRIDEAVQERQTPLRFNYDNHVEEKIFGEFKNWYDIFIKFRMACDAYAKQRGLDVAPGITTTRDAAAIVKYIKHNSKTIDQIMREKFTQTKEKDYLIFLKKQFCDYYHIHNLDDELNVPRELRKADTLILAKSFVKACNEGIEER